MSFQTLDLVAGDTNAVTTELISLDSKGGPADFGSENPVLSGDGRYVAFMSFAADLVCGDTNEHVDVFVRDRVTATTTRASQADNDVEPNNESYHPAISADGGYVAFLSWATNLLAGDTNENPDIFITDRHA